MIDPVERNLVHKLRSENVFIGEPQMEAVGEYRTAATFPLFHTTYNDTPTGLSASGYLIEVARQANLALCHRFFDIPTTAGFLVASIDWRFASGTPFVVQDFEPFEVVTRVVGASRRQGRLAKLATRSRFVGRSGEFLSGGATFLIASRRLTTPRRADPTASVASVDPVRLADAQVSSPDNVFLGTPSHDLCDGPRRLCVLVRRDHPYFFEHQNSHVPGMMLLEAGKQAAVYSAQQRYSLLDGAYGDLNSGEIRFGRFATLDEPVFVVCECGSLAPVDQGFQVPMVVSFEQSNKRLGQIKASVAFLDEDEAIGQSAVIRHQLAMELTRTAVDIPMNGAFQ